MLCFPLSQQRNKTSDIWMEEMASDLENRYEYVEQVAEDSRQGVFLRIYMLSGRLTISRFKTIC
jgi:hypothetical protein